MKKITDNHKLAAKYHVSLKTIARWKNQGAPFGNDAAMKNWLASKKHVPQQTVVAITKPVKKIPVSQSPIKEGAQGVAGALKRLEAAEARAFAALEQSLDSGNPIEIKLAREGWLKISESLRKYDLAVEQSRRDAGELIPREAVENLLSEFPYFARLYLTHFCAARLLHSLGLEADGCNIQKIQLYLDDTVKTTLANFLASQSAGFPPWAVAALKSDMKCCQGEAGARDIEVREKSLRAFCEIIPLLDTHPTGQQLMEALCRALGIDDPPQSDNP